MHPEQLPEETHTLIVGAGFAGIGAAIRLLQAGLDEFVMIERADELGGVWRDNTYPGCACDVPSHLYSFSFAPNPDWSRAYSPQAEILAYLRRCADGFGVTPRIRLGTELQEAAWDEGRRRWRVHTSRGELWASVLIMGSGAFSAPSIPQLPGLDRFAGRVFHSARWEHGHDLAGRRVAVVGTGASAVQLVPQIQPVVGRLMLFQRTPAWVLPRRDRPLSYAERRIFARLPIAQRLLRGLIYGSRELMVPAFRHPTLMALAQRMAERHLARSVPDPALRARLTPSYTLGCKRILPSNDYLPALARPNVELVTDPIRELRPEGLVTADGALRPADTLIFATGFAVSEPPIAGLLRGRDGRSLRELWAGSPRAYLGTTVAGFPNLFLLQGPGTGLGHSSVLAMLEVQLEHVVGALRHMRAGGLAAVEPRPEAQAAFVAAVDRRMRGTVWTAGGCRSWYLDATGRNSTLWPDSIGAFRRRASRFNPADYLLSAPQPAPAALSQR